MRQLFRRTGTAAVAALALVIGSVALSSSANAASKCVVLTASSGACITTTSYAKSTFKVNYHDAMYNKTSHTQHLECTSDVTKTVKQTFSAEVEAEFHVAILASMKAKVGYSLEKSVTVHEGSTVKIAISPHKWGHCERGIYTTRASGKIVYSYFGGGSGTYKTTYWTSTAPSHPAWVVYESSHG